MTSLLRFVPDSVSVSSIGSFIGKADRHIFKKRKGFNRFNPVRNEWAGCSFGFGSDGCSRVTAGKTIQAFMDDFRGGPGSPDFQVPCLAIVIPDGFQPAAQQFAGVTGKGRVYLAGHEGSRPVYPVDLVTKHRLEHACRIGRAAMPVGLRPDVEPTPGASHFSNGQLEIPTSRAYPRTPASNESMMQGIVEECVPFRP